MKIEGIKALVIGLGKSGFSASKFLAENGARVTAVDTAAAERLQTDVKLLKKLGVEVFTNDNSLRRLELKDLVVTSPGVQLEHPLITGARRVGIPVISELELGYRFCNGVVIAITGTNGKSTTTSLIGAIFEKAGIPHFVAGNIGTPITSVIPANNTAAILEVSSFQLELVDTFNPQIAVWLNLTPDHLGRHGSIDIYAAAKARIFERHTNDEILIYNDNDPIVCENAETTSGIKLPFSTSDSSGIFIEQRMMKYKHRGLTGVIVSIDEILIKGKHNLENSMAAAGAALAYGIDTEYIAETLRTFPGIEHRQEYVTSIKSTHYINDSKATNLDSTLKALETIEEPILLIAGGRGKGESYFPASDLVSSKVKAIISFGESAEQIIRELSPFTDTMYARDLENAVMLAQENALPGDTVLLSPMCASFDMFSNFEERGAVFKSIVMKLKNGKEE